VKKRVATLCTTSVKGDDILAVVPTMLSYVDTSR
jgi:hypothetical protein